MKVNFNGDFRKSNYNLCDGCHAISRVVELELPETKHHDGKHLETRYRWYWLCDECREALTKLLNRLEAESEVE